MSKSHKAIYRGLAREKRANAEWQAVWNNAAKSEGILAAALAEAHKRAKGEK